MSYDDNNQSADVPEEISYTNEDLDRDMRRPRLRANTVYLGKVAFANKVVNKTGTLAIETVWNPLDPDKRARGPSARKKLTLPFANSKNSSAKIPDTLGFCHEDAHALYPERFPRYPKRQRDGSYLTADGQVVNKETAISIERQIKKDVRDFWAAAWKNPATLVGEVAYFQVEDTEWRGVNKIYSTSELPDGVNVCMSDFASAD